MNEEGMATEGGCVGTTWISALTAATLAGSHMGSMVPRSLVFFPLSSGQNMDLWVAISMWTEILCM